MGQIQFYLVVITIVGIFVSRQSAFYYLVCYSAANFVCLIMTLTFQRGRPYMVVDDLKPPICLETFGTPNSAIFEFVTMIVVFIKNP